MVKKKFFVNKGDIKYQLGKGDELAMTVQIFF